MNWIMIVVVAAIAFTAGVAWGRRGGGALGVGFSSRQGASGSHGSRPSPATGYSFTEDVRKSLSRSREEAGLLGNDYVGPEHILLGLIHVKAGNSALVLERLRVDPATLRNRVLAVVQRGAAHNVPDLPYTSRAKRVLEMAMYAARDLRHDHVGTEHLLLGLAQDTGPVGQVLADAGADEQAVRRETLAVMSK